jgi:hypothetical protein
MTSRLASLALALGIFSVGCSDHGVTGLQGDGADTTASVRVQWTKSPFHDVSGYRVYRGASADFALDGAPFVDVSANATSALVPNVPKGTNYFKVVALGTLTNYDGKPSASAPVTVQVEVK